MSELARRLIEKNRRTRATALRLANCGLSQIPAEVTDLVWLESLSFADDLQAHGVIGKSNQGANGNHITNVRPLAGLKNLRFLVLTDMSISDLAPLAGLSALEHLYLGNSAVANLAPLADLGALCSLDLSWTLVTDLAPLMNCSALRSLNLSHTTVSDVAPLSALPLLTRLNLSVTAVSDLRPLATLPELRDLNLSGSLVDDLTPLTALSEIHSLDLSGTAVTDLAPLRLIIDRGISVQKSPRTWGSNGICLEGCPLINPPPEIVNHGSDAIRNYFREREAGGVDHLYEAKMLIVGEGGAGKTSLLRRLYQPDLPLPTERETTKGISVHRHEFQLKNGRTFRLNVWDFGGQEIYHATHQFFLTRRSLYLLLDDTRAHHKSVSDEGFRYWLELIDLFGGHSPVLIFQNEKGGRSKAIDLGGIKGQYDNVKERYSGNLERKDAADHLRDAIEFFAAGLNHIGEELPARWIKVRADIEARAAQIPHITVQEYFEIYGRHLEFDRTKALHLSRYLHDLGVFLHFQDHPLLARTVILRNSWATEAVFRILDDETIKARLGRFGREECERLWRDSEYADMHLELLALMQRFELCYVLPDSQPPASLAPQLLPPAKPVAVTDWGRPDDLVLRYRYNFLPKGVISRLTVRQHRFVRDPELAWVTGVLFERGDTSVLVELLPIGGEIELRARGPERKALLSVISSDLDALNDSFQGLRDKVEKRIPCNCTRCRVAAVPEFFEQRYLLQRKLDDRLKVECRRSYENVDVLNLLDGIRIENLPGWAKEPSRAAAGAAISSGTLRIFVASSAELREDRDAFDLYVRQQNDRLRKRGLYLEIVRCETFLDAMSDSRLQDEYNRAIQSCDIFVSLFFTKTGKFTEEEFEVAHRHFKETQRPRIYTFFKNAPITTANARESDLTSLWEFKKKLEALGHFHTSYDSIEHLKRHFRDQLDKLLE